MKNIFKKIIHNFVIYLKSLYLCISKKPLICTSILLFGTLMFAGVYLISSPIDNQLSLEITRRVTDAATQSKYKIGLSSVSMECRDNSDYYIYSDNELQNFQMRNQQYEGNKTYVFAGYKPYGDYYPLSYFNQQSHETIKCTSLLFESKYDGTGFYFDLPILFGTIGRFENKNSIILLDTVAEKIVSGSGFEIDSLIGQTLVLNSSVRSGKSSSVYKVDAILNSNNRMGSFLISVFGENIMFTSDYSSFQMNGACYFCSTIDTKENKIMVDFILEKFKTTSSASRNLKNGYFASFSFYNYDAETNQHKLSKNNDDLNKLLNYYNGIMPVLLLTIGCIVLFVGLLFFIKLVISENRLNEFKNIGISLLLNWILLSISFLIISLVYKELPIAALIAKVNLESNSTVASSALFIGWIVINIITIFAVLISRKIISLKVD